MSIEAAQQRYEERTRSWRLARGAATSYAQRVQVAAARVELYDVLVADGWRPDELVVAQVAQDRDLVLADQIAREAFP